MMKRRDFLKLIGVAPIAPSVLAAMPKKELTVTAARKFVDKLPKNQPDCICMSSTPSESYMILVGENRYWKVNVLVYEGATKTVTIDGVLPEEFYVK